ncbi:MAG: hypothetical protein JO053_09320, partial [Acidobacteria bacterium]|nr:hypothetical protein [Acidobacteriota bacterium]
VATGHYRNGILLAPITAQIISDKIIHGKDHSAFENFWLGRFRKGAATAK